MIITIDEPTATDKITVERTMIITIDGPTASGKSTVGRTMAHLLGYYYIYSGILYRALAYILVFKYDYDIFLLANPNSADLNACLARLRYEYNDQAQERVIYDGQDITAYLKTNLMDTMSSTVSQNQLVRDNIMQLQRDIALRNNVVVDGRDAGSVVFEHAQYKFFLTASIEVRAQRWAGQQKKQGNLFSLDQARRSITERDMRDMQRAIAPLIIPDGAMVIDNSALNVEQTVQEMMSYINV